MDTLLKNRVSTLGQVFVIIHVDCLPFPLSTKIALFGVNSHLVKLNSSKEVKEKLNV